MKPLASVCPMVFTAGLAACAIVLAEETPALAPVSSMTPCVKGFQDAWAEMVAAEQQKAEKPAAGAARDLIRPRRSSERFKWLAESAMNGALEMASSGASTEEKTPPTAPVPLPQVVFPQAELGYEGISRLDQLVGLGMGEAPPDTMGAIGYNHFVETLNGSFAIFDKFDGRLLDHVSLTTFFRFFHDGVAFPRFDSTDPRVLFDQRSGRWLATALESGTAHSNHVVLAISQTEDPTGGWTKYLLAFGEAEADTDYDTLGTDDNGVYVAVRMFPTGLSRPTYAKIVALEKDALLRGAEPTNYFFNHITNAFSTPQPAHNVSGVGPNGPAWFVASSPRTLSGSNSLGLVYATLRWQGTAGARRPVMTGFTYLATPLFADPVPAPAKDTYVPIHTSDYRLLMAVLRSNQLWTCRNVGMNASGQSTRADRTGCEWLQLALSGLMATVAQRGRVYDPATVDPHSYYYPSLNVSGQGHVAMGFSGSSRTNYVSAYYTGRLRGDPLNTMRPVQLLRAGQGHYELPDRNNRNRWGDYSFTSVDPDDDMTFWTIQEYARGIDLVYQTPIWGTYISTLLAPEPVLVNPHARARPGQQGVVLRLNGARFFDPGDGFTYTMGVEITGGDPNGVTNIVVSQITPTSLRVRFDVLPEAAPGWRDLTVVNPDGQFAVATEALWIESLTDIALRQEANATASAGETMTWTLLVTNQGAVAATGIRITNTLPASVCFLTAPASPPFTRFGNKVVFHVGILAPGEARLLPFEVLVTSPGRIVNLAQVASDAVDLVWSNNTSRMAITVSPASPPRRPLLSIDDVQVREGDSGTVNANFTVCLKPASAQTLHVSYATANGSAVAGRDYRAASGTLAFLPGETTKRVRVTVLNDRLAEWTEQFHLALRAGPAVQLVRGLGTATIFDNPDPGRVILENRARIEIPLEGTATPYPSELEVTGVIGSIVKTRLTLHGLTHEYASDVNALLVGPNGQTVMTISGAGGVNRTPDEGVTLTFDDTAAQALPLTAALTSGTFRPSSYEGRDTLPSPAPQSPASRELAVFNGTDPNGLWALYVFDDAHEDRGAILDGWSLEFVTGEADLRVGMEVVAGPYPAGSLATYLIGVTNHGPGWATNVILTDVLPPGAALVTSVPPFNERLGNILTFQLDSLQPGEGAVFSVTLSNGLAGTNLHLATVASDNLDSMLENNTAGRVIQVLPLVRITAPDDLASEPGANTAFFRISRTGGTVGALPVSYGVGGTATGGEDYTALSGTAIIPHQAAFLNVVLRPKDDRRVELDETVVLALSGAGQYLLDGTAAEATATIRDDDRPLISIDNLTAQESAVGTNFATFQLRLSAATSRTVSVMAATRNGTAVAPQDFIATRRTVTFAPGSTNEEFRVPILSDGISEPDEVFTVRLSTPVNASLQIAQAEGILVDPSPALAAEADAALAGPVKINLVVARQEVWLSFASEIGKRYTVEVTPALGVNAAWTSLSMAQDLPGTGKELRVQDAGAASASQRFYRLRID